MGEERILITKCPGCGCDILGETDICPFCDYKIKKRHLTSGPIESSDKTEQISLRYEPNLNKESSNAEKRKTDYRLKYLGISAIIAACIFLVVAYSRVNNKDYKECGERYNEYMEGYEQNKYSSQTEGILFRGLYNTIADEYKEMADEKMDEMRNYRIQAVISAVIGGGLLIGGLVLLKKGGEA